MSLRRILSVLLALTMLISVFAETAPMRVSATEITEDTVQLSEEPEQEETQTEPPETETPQTEPEETEPPETETPQTEPEETGQPETEPAQTEPAETEPLQTQPEETTETTAPATQPTEETEAAQPPAETTEATVPEEELQTRQERILPREIPDDFVPPHADTRRLTKINGMSESLPASYDARNANVVTSVKDQGGYGLCWAFSAMAVGESHLVSQGIAGLSIDLSERHLGYYAQTDAYDPLGNATGDSTKLSGNYLTMGNNNKFVTFAMANWVGAASEARYPYNVDPSSHGPAGAMEDVAHLTNAFWINPGDTDIIKHYIMQNGGVSLSYYAADENMNAATNAYYNSTEKGANHAITVVGWDDNFSASNFLTNPGADGAWLCKNSWGTWFGDKGYFWLSYRDLSINQSNSPAFVFEFGSGDNYTWNYHYDGSCGVGYQSILNGGSVANVYKAAGTSNTELIRAVGIGLASTDVDYSVQIYRNPTDPSDPTSGTPALSKPQTGKSHLCGYYTIPLQEPVRVKHGDTFAVVITLSGSGGNVSIFVDSSYKNGTWISFTSSTEPNQSFYSSDSGWYDLHNNGRAARVKAYTVAAADVQEVPLSGLSFRQETVSMAPGEVFSQEPVREPDNAAYCQLFWSSADSSIASVTSNGTVTALRTGQTTITVSTADGSVSASYTLKVKTQIDAIEILASKARMSVGETFTPKAQVVPAAAAPEYTLKLTSSDPEVVKVDGDVLQALSAGRARITFQAGMKTASYDVTVVDAAAQITLDVEPVAYSGGKAIPKVTVTREGTVLQEGSDYTLSFRNNSRPGTGTVTAAGEDWEQSANFKIYVPVPKNLALSNETSSVRLSWARLPGMSGYILHRRTGTGKWEPLAKVSGGSTTGYTDKKGLLAGTRYGYRICAYVTVDGITYEGEYTQASELIRLPPTTIRRVTAADGGFQITWNPAANATGYRVLRKEEGGEAREIAYVDGQSSLTYTDCQSIPVGSSCGYSVIVQSDAAGLSSSSAPSPYRQAYRPSAPKLNTVSNTSSGIRLTWNTTPYATGYEIRRSTDGEKWFTVKTVTDGKVTLWTDTYCSSGTRYQYRIRTVVNRDGGVWYSGLSSTGAVSRLTTPSVQKVAQSSEGLTVRWNAVSGATSYRVTKYLDGKLIGQVGQIHAGTTRSFTDREALQTGVRYSYSVTAVKTESGWEDVSAESVKRSACIPSTPAMRAVANIKSGIKLRWTASAGATGYEIYRSTNGGKWSKVKTVAGGTTTTWTDTYRDSGTRYSYRVCAYASVDAGVFRSANSGALSIYRLSTPTLSSIAVSSKSITVTWKKVKGATSYQVLRSVDSGAFVPIYTTTSGSVLKYTDSKATGRGICYTYMVVARRSDSVSGNSSTRSACRLSKPLLKSVTTNYTGSRLRWEPVKLATGYEIYRSTNGRTWSKVKTVSGGSVTNWKDTARAGATPYVYRIAAIAKLDSVTYRSAMSNKK